MAFESITDDRIAALLRCAKRVKNPQARWKTKAGHKQMNYMVIAEDGSGHEFEVYLRQNMREGMEDDFSCGISWIATNGEVLTLKRYNGASHSHPNHLENERLGYVCHIHIATEKYIKANKKAEGFATQTDRYKSLQGALHCLVTDCKVSGLNTHPDIDNQQTLFD